MIPAINVNNAVKEGKGRKEEPTTPDNPPPRVPHGPHPSRGSRDICHVSSDLNVTTGIVTLGIQRFVSSYTECLLLLPTSIHVLRLSQARRLPATRERDPEDSSASQQGRRDFVSHLRAHPGRDSSGSATNARSD